MAAVAKHDSLLLFVEGDIAVVGDGLAGSGIGVEEPSDGLPIHEMRSHDLGGIFRFHFRVEDALGLHRDYGASLAETVAPGELDTRPLGDAVPQNLLLQRRLDLSRAR